MPLIEDIFTLLITLYLKKTCKMEMKYLFDRVPSEKYLFSDYYVEPSRSPFIKDMISIIYEEDSLAQITERL